MNTESEKIIRDTLMFKARQYCKDKGFEITEMYVDAEIDTEWDATVHVEHDAGYFIAYICRGELTIECQG